MDEAKVFARQLFEKRKCAFNVKDFEKAVKEPDETSEKRKSLSSVTELRVL